MGHVSIKHMPESFVYLAFVAVRLTLLGSSKMESRTIQIAMALGLFPPPYPQANFYERKLLAFTRQSIF